MGQDAKTIPAVAGASASSPAPAAADAPAKPQNDQKIGSAARVVTLAEALEALHKADDLPQGTDAERKVREKTLAAARKTFFDLQQGLPLVNISASDYARVHSKSASDVRLARLQLAARSNIDVAWLLSEYLSLRDQQKQ